MFLDQGQRLKHRVVQMRRDLSPLLGPDPAGALPGQGAGHQEEPRQQHRADDRDPGRRQDGQPAEPSRYLGVFHGGEQRHEQDRRDRAAHGEDRDGHQHTGVDRDRCRLAAPHADSCRATMTSRGVTQSPSTATRSATSTGHGGGEVSFIAHSSQPPGRSPAGPGPPASGI